MRTIQATDTAVSIWFRGEAPPARPRLLALVRQALTEQGLAPWPEMEAECFTAGTDALVIARPARDRRAAFRFGDLEALLSGVLASPGGPSALYRDGNGYLLAADSGAPALYEFGQAGTVSADWEAHAAEQGLCLMSRDAIARLHRLFST